MLVLPTDPVTAMIFYALLPPAEGLTFLRFLGIYIAAYIAGIAASLPGGIGVFDTLKMVAKLVLTDELLAAARERAKPGPLSEGSPWEDIGQGDTQGNASDDERSDDDG